MDSNEHKILTNFIKGVHQKLRKDVNSCCDPEKVWTEHLENQELRKIYSDCMFKLATKIWKGKESRIKWTHKACLDYFYNGGLERSVSRQINLKKKLLKLSNDRSYDEIVEAISLQNNFVGVQRKLALLDVGSCYNPFSQFEEFDSTAIDLTPATKDVLQFDFLTVEIVPKIDEDSPDILQVFLEKKYDIVVLSLVLEYLPTPKQRAIFCYKSWQLLKENGLCIIITPDSKSINYNARMMKSWKLALEKLSFIRVKYEKLQHLHCMAFRKLNIIDNICDLKYTSELLYIPQDFMSYTEKEVTVTERTEEENSQISSIFSELPGEDNF